VDLGLAGKVALVAGGSDGFGLAIARELAAEGAHVAIGARDQERLAGAERVLKEVARGRIQATSVDITVPGAVTSWVEDVVADLGGLQVVVANGASPPFGAASDFTTADYQQAVDGVLLPAVHLALTALPHLRASGWGRLLFLTSETASGPIASLALSGVTRAGIVRFAQSLASEVGRDNITVNVLAPGTARTSLVERAATAHAEDGDVEAQLRAMGRHTALGRMAQPAEIAAVAAFLASERASYVTGVIHLIDGGASVIGSQLPHLKKGVI
jgi:3-oxoacyl-[acyl-carrier protein] reductase